MPTALITGVGGQDGSYLSELLLERGTGWSARYRTPIRRHRTDPARAGPDRNPPGRPPRPGPHRKIFRDHRPDEVYNFAANSVLAASFREPILATMVLAMGVTRMLEAIRKVTPKTRFFQASSSEIFGKPAEVPQSETTPFHPRNPYGVSKVYGHLMAMTYRENYGMYACSGILYNHESPRRSPEFVTRKITRAAAMIKLGHSKELRLGNLEARRDWGYASDYVRGMWLMLQQPQPDDYVLATGESPPCGNCARRRSRTSGLITTNTSSSKQRVFVLRRHPNSLEIQGRPAASLAGRLPFPFGTSYG